MQVTDLRIKKKITAVFADGSQKMNLGIPSVQELLANQTSPVKVHANVDDPEVHERVAALTAALGRPLEATQSPELWTLTAQVPEAVVPKAEVQAVAVMQANPTPLPETPTQTAIIGHPDQLPPIHALDTTGLDTSELIVPVTTSSTDADLERLYPPAAQRIRNGTIVLGAQEIFLDCEKALAHLQAQLKAMPPVTLPKRYHAELTQTFFKGTVEGQIHSVFKDLKKFGPQVKVLQKIVSLLDYAKTSSDPLYRTYIYFLKQGMMPHHTITFHNGRLRMSFFKLWALYEIHNRMSATKYDLG